VSIFRLVSTPDGFPYIDETGHTLLLSDGSIFLAEVDSYSEMIKILHPIKGLARNNNTSNIVALNFTSDLVVAENEISSNECDCDLLGFFEGIDFFGGDLPEALPAESSKQCCILCRATEMCNAWSYAVKSSTCWVKSFPSIDDIPKITDISITSGIFRRSAQVGCLKGSTHGSRSRLFSPSPSYYTKKKIEIGSKSPFKLHRDTTSIDWTEQWPVGIKAIFTE
jgi:hypothetical protein